MFYGALELGVIHFCVGGVGKVNFSLPTCDNMATLLLIKVLHYILTCDITAMQII
jgi:hypothetical protein